MNNNEVRRLACVKTKIIFNVLFTLNLFFSSILLHASEKLDDAIFISIEPMRDSYLAADSLEVRVSYTNTSSAPVRFLKWNTALEKTISDDFLVVRLNGQTIPYIGMHIKRLPPTNADFITLQSGQIASEVIDLASSYSIITEGEYQILYKGVDANASKSTLKAAGGAILNVAESRPVQLFRRDPIINNSCTATQVNQINQALTIAEQIAVRAASDLTNAPVAQRPSARRYIEWFGAHSTLRYESVRIGMQNIANALVNQRIGFDCTCADSRRENLFAFVFSNDPFNMNVCPVFFRVAASGTDSRSGTIVHEISHFNVVAATDDFSSALDQGGSRVLARNSPNSAIRNANAFEYFAENTPFLSMPSAAPTPTLPPETPEPAPEPEPEPEPATSFLGGLLLLLLGDD